MNKSSCIALILLTGVLLSLVGCAVNGGGIGSAKKEEAARKAAEEYAAKLREVVNDDSIRFTDKEPGLFGKESYTFTLWTDKYEKEFEITINGDIQSDSYSTASVRDSAKEEWGKVLDEFTGYKITYEVDTNMRIIASPLCMRTFDSIYEAQEAYDYPALVEATITFTDDSYRNQERMYMLMEEIRENGLYGKVNFTGDDSDYEIDKDGIYVWWRTGADGGAYIERIPFTPDVE